MDKLSGEFDLNGKLAVVTGASRGLGQFMARALARAGADLIITSRNKTDCADLIKEIQSTGRKAEAFSLQLREESSITDFANTVLSKYKYIDVLVNNAGCNIRKTSLEITWDDWNTILETNLRGMFFLCKAFAPAMIARNYGKIINIGSVTSVFGYGGIVPYCASRGGVFQLSKALADEWGEYGINVNVLAPGWFQTKQNEELYQNKEWYDYICDRIPMRRPGKPNDLDGTIVFLASDASQYITGQIILIDGGITTGSTKAIIKLK